jgi:hypothetical protein
LTLCFVSSLSQAELRPLVEGEYTQLDEDDMGMTYEELGIYGRLRKINKCGPVRMFVQLTDLWRDKNLSFGEIAVKVRLFYFLFHFSFYSTFFLRLRNFSDFIQLIVIN